MQLLLIIFRFEWRQFLRQPSQLLILLFFLGVGCYSLNNGHRFIERQLTGLDSLMKNQQVHTHDLISRFHSDTTTAKGKLLAAQAGLPQVVEFRAPPVAFNPPQALALMAIGQRDLLPYFDVITIKRDVFTPPNAEIANPEKLSAGNFDLSFVLIYLFPLLVVILSYDVLSKEKEQQTYQLLAIQGAKIYKIITYKMVFRAVVVCMLVLLLSITGFLIRPAATVLNFKDFLLWCLINLTYLLFWFSVCWLVVMLRKSSRINAFSLLGVWLILTLVLPAMASKVVEVADPMPLRTALASSQREVMAHTWEMPITELLDTFYHDNPQYKKLRNVSDTAQYGNKRFVAYYDLLNRRMNNNIRKYNQGADRHNQLLNRMAWYNPVAQLQYLLNATAQTGLGDYLYYQEEVNRFQNQWTAFMNGYLLRGQKFSLEEVQHLPQFKPRTDESRPGRILVSILSVWIAILLVLFISNRIKRAV